MSINYETTNQFDIFEADVCRNEQNLGYVALMLPDGDMEYNGITFTPNDAYERYLRMHKVFVGQRGAEQLVVIHEALKDEVMPRYMSTAGWAAAEAAVVQVDKAVEDRLRLLDAAADCWQRALIQQRNFNASAPEHLVEYAGPYRTAMDIAVTPLLRTMVTGYVPREVCKQVFNDCLNIAQANAIRLNLMVKEGNIQGIAEHVGFGYECNALLAINRRFAGTRIAIPSTIRSDSGYYHRQQTHDLLIIQQNRGIIQQVTPVEIKAAASANDRLRYKALLVRGKMHLSVPGKCKPEEMLAIITACHERTATAEEYRIADDITSQFLDMFNDYCAGDAIEGFASSRSLTVFHNNSLVAARHPGLLAKAG